MDRRGDVLGALAWGLRRYAWVVATAVIVIGVLVPFGLSRSAPVYEAEAILAPNKQLAIPSLDALPRYGEVVFASGAVADSVREAFGLSTTTPVIPERVELVAEQDNVAFTVIGRSDTPDGAAELANTAAASFQLELNQTSDAVGYYIVLNAAEPPVSAQPRFAGGTLALAIGLLGGLIVGLALVTLLVVVRRPVLDPTAVEGVTSAPVLGRITLPRGGGEVREHDAQGVAGLCRRLLASPSSVILLVSPRSAVSLRHRLTPVLTALLGHSRRVLAGRGGDQDLATQWRQGVRRSGHKLRSAGGPGMRKFELALVDGPTADERINRPDSSLMVLVVPEGIGLTALRKAADEYLDGGPTGVVLVRERGLGRFRLGSGSSQTERPADMAPAPAELNGRGRADDERPSIFVDHEEEPPTRTPPSGERDTSPTAAPTTGRP